MIQDGTRERPIPFSRDLAVMTMNGFFNNYPSPPKERTRSKTAKVPFVCDKAFHYSTPPQEASRAL